MKFAAPLFVASVLATSALAYSTVPEAQFESRDLSEFSEDPLVQRAFVEGLAGRELSDEEFDLVSRKFSFGKIFKGAARIGKGLLGFRRDLDGDELDAREYFEELADRELDDEELDLLARKFRIGKIFKGAARIGKGLLGFRRDLEDLAGREITDEELELAARKFRIGKIFKGAARIGKGLLGFRRDLDMDELDAREYVEELVGRELDDEEFDLLARKFRIGKLFKGAAKIGKGLLGFRRDLDMDELDARDFEDLEEIDARDFEDLEELEARFGLLPFKLAKGAAKMAFKGARKLFGREEMLEGDLVERDLDYDDLFEREYEVDELD